MKKAAGLAVLVLAAFVLAACGGDGSGTTAVSNSPSAVKDLTFVNVPPVTTSGTVVLGQRAVEVTAFRMSWADPSRRQGIGQMIFQVAGGDVSLKDLFSWFRLVDGSGNNVNSEAAYATAYDDATRTVTIDFYGSPWLPSDGGATPATYSLLADLDPTAPETTFQLKLATVQMHDASSTVDTGDVEGAAYAITDNISMALPIINTTSPSTIQGLAGQSGVAIGNFTATCPSTDTTPCYFSRMTFNTNGMENTTVFVNGTQLDVNCGSGSGYNQCNTPIRLAIPPGTSATFEFHSNVTSSNASLSVQPGMTWEVGNGTFVSPIVPKTKNDTSNCDLLVNDQTYCK